MSLPAAARLAMFLVMTSKPKQPLSYRDAGVDIDAGDHLVDLIKPFAEKTRRPEVLAGLGGFGALFELPLDNYRRPVLVSSTDGVGTKLKLAIDACVYDTVGIDLVAMCVNDLIVQGAEPLFFLDYYATGRLDPEAAALVVKGIARGCEIAGAALVGGETAEMPGMYREGDFDLAGFSVGIVEKSAIIDGSKVRAGDAIVGIAASGPHSNGYSLIRRILEVTGARLDDRFGSSTLGRTLLEPTRIYVKPLLHLFDAVDVHALAHITGGGLPGNVPRVLPDDVCAVIDPTTWRRPAIFDWLQEHGNVASDEMYRTFNCGLGMIAIVAETDVERTIQQLAIQGETAWRVGVVEPLNRHKDQVVIRTS